MTTTGPDCLDMSVLPPDLINLIGEIALQVADNTNTALFLGKSGNIIADSFDALTYVDQVNSVNLDVSTAGVLKPTVVPPSYSNTGGTGARTGLGYTISSAASWTGATTILIDGTTTNDSGIALANGTAVAGISVWRIDFGVGASKVITEVKLYMGTNNGTQGVWKFQGSNDASTWTDLGTNISPIGGADLIDSSMSANTTGYRYYQYVGVSGTSASSLRTNMDELEFKISDAPLVTNNATIYLGPFTAAQAPTLAKALMRVKEVNAAVAGVDYTLRISRDNKATWTSLTLTELFTALSPVSGIRVIDAAATDISTSGSGTAIWLEFKNLNNKMVELHDLFSYWTPA